MKDCSATRATIDCKGHPKKTNGVAQRDGIREPLFYWAAYESIMIVASKQSFTVYILILVPDLKFCFYVWQTTLVIPNTYETTCKVLNCNF